MTPPPKLPMRASKNAPKRAICLIVVHVLAALHIGHWMATGETLSPLEPSEAMEFSKHSIINAGFVFFALTILSTLILGRWFCGWACHLVALQDLSLWILNKVGVKPKPFRSRLLALVPLIAAIYMFLWPLVYRAWVGEISRPRLELTKAGFWDTFPPLGVALLTFFVCGSLIIYFLGAKGFCTYGCPYGGIFGIVDSLAPGRIRVTDACEGCAHCTATCTSNVRVHEEVRDHGMVIDPGCMKCLDCVSVCPMNALYFGVGKPALLKGAAKTMKGSYSIAEEITLGALFVILLTVYRGLYGRIPFLLALGIAAILAYLFFTLGRLFLKDNLSLGKKALKKGGRLTPSGKGFLSAMVLVVLATTHSAFIRASDFWSKSIFESTFELQERALGRGEPPSEAEAARIQSGIKAASLFRNYGLFPSADVDLRLAWFRLVEGDDAGFEERFLDALEQHPDSLLLHEDLGRFYQSRGRGADAEGHFKKALELHPSVAAFHRLAQLYFGTNQPALGVKTYEEAILKFAENADLRFNLGIAYGMEGRQQEAFASFEEVLRLDPSRYDAHENLGRGHLASRNFQEAIAHFQKALELAPQNLDNLELLIIAYIETGQISEARAAVQRARESGFLPANAAARFEALIEQYGTKPEGND